MLEQARTSARKAGAANASFENADAQTAPLPRARFDLLFSRFGVMFFGDPTAAFTNLRSSLKPGARLTFVCWRPVQENPWMFVPVMAAAQHIAMPPPPAPDAPGPFGFADTERVRTILTGAGFTDIAFEAADEKVDVGGGSGLDATVDFLLQMGPTGNAVREAGASPEVLKNVSAAVRESLLPYQTPDGIRMDAAVWIVTAKNA
jgi:SAM-dependent methyltransferase